MYNIPTFGMIYFIFLLIISDTPGVYEICLHDKKMFHLFMSYRY